MAPQWAWVPRSVPPQQILSLHVKCAGPQFRRPPKKLRLPRCCASPEFSYSLTLREKRSGSPVSAFICWVCTKHAVSPQVLRLPRIYLFRKHYAPPQIRSDSPVLMRKSKKSSGDRPIIALDFDTQKNLRRFIKYSPNINQFKRADGNAFESRTNFFFNSKIV